MGVASCYLHRAEGKEHAAVITLRDRGEGRRGTLQVGNHKKKNKLRSGSDAHTV